MRYPALLPAGMLLLGTVAGCFIPAPGFVLVGLICALCVSSAVCLLLERPRVLVVSAAAGFCAAGWLLGMDADVRARGSPLRGFFDRDVQPLGVRAGPVLLDGVLRQDAQVLDGGVGLDLFVERVTFEGRSAAASGGVRLTVGGRSAPRVGEWRAGRRLQLPATLRRPLPYLNPGVTDQEVLSALRGVVLLGSVKSAALVDVAERGSRIAEWCAAVRALVRRAMAEAVGYWDQRSAAVTTAVLIGDRAGLGRDVEEQLQAAGTYHVIAISGGNIAILAGFILGVLRLARVGARVAGTTTIAALSVYALLVGAVPSVLRATLVANVYLIGRLGDQRTPPLNAVGVAGLIALCATPLSTFDAGFALSFGATVGILLMASPISEAITRRLMRPAIDRIGRRAPPQQAAFSPLIARAGERLVTAAGALIAATLAAEIMLLPLSAWAFSRVSFAGLVLNLFAIPLMSLAQIAGMATVVCWVLIPSAARLVGYLAHLGASGLVDTSGFVSLAPWLSLRLPPPEWPIVACYFAALGVALSARLPRVRAASCAIAALIGLWVLCAPPVTLFAREAWPDQPSMLDAEDELLSVTFLDVGQGDAALLRFPGGESMIVDTGGGGAFDVGGRVLVPAAWRLGVRHLAFLALTHGDPDHIGGARAVIRDLRPREVWEGVPVPFHTPMQVLHEEAKIIGAGWRQQTLGDVLTIGSVRIDVAHPPSPDWERRKVRNDDSLVLDVRLGDVSILLCGDVGRDVEPEIAHRLSPSRLRIVKVPHHGSSTSSSALFLDAIQPAAAVVSAGRANSYGHPRPDVLDRYRHVGAALFRTDEEGAVQVLTNGTQAIVRTMRGRTLRLDSLQPRWDP